MSNEPERAQSNASCCSNLAIKPIKEYRRRLPRCAWRIISYHLINLRVVLRSTTYIKRYIQCDSPESILFLTICGSINVHIQKCFVVLMYGFNDLQ